MRALLLAAAVSLVLPSAAHALCARPEESIETVNAGAVLPADGGLLLVTTFEYANKPPPKRDTWRLLVDGTETTVKPVVLAPGLEVYRLPASAKAGELREGSTTLAAVTVAGGRVPALGAPKVAKATTMTSIRPRFTATRVTVTLTTEVPADAIALVIADAKTGKAHAFGRIIPTTNTVDVYAQGRCSALPNGTVEPRAGARYVVRWVDKHGRLSASSKAFTLARIPDVRP